MEKIRQILLKFDAKDKVLMFTKTKRMADDLGWDLKRSGVD